MFASHELLMTDAIVGTTHRRDADADMTFPSSPGGGLMTRS
jgi:hypothetical protein